MRFDTYKDLLTLQTEKIQALINRISLMRLVLFFGLVALFFLCFEEAWRIPSQIGFLLALIVFLGLLKWHDRLFRKMTLRREFIRQAENDQRRLNRDFQHLEHGLTQDSFASEHPFAHDLDFLEENSIFKLFGGVFHSEARRELVSWFGKELSLEETQRRQEAIRELASYCKMRRHFIANCRMESEASWTDQLGQEWEKKTAPKGMSGLLLVGMVTASLSTGCLFASFFFGVETPWLWFLTIQAVFVFFSNSYLKDHILAFLQVAPRIRAFGENLQKVTQANWTSSLLVELKSRIKMDTMALSREAKLVEKLNEALLVRQNGFAFLTLNLLFNWDLIYFFRLVRWKKRKQWDLVNWFHIAMQFEALGSLAHFSYLFPRYCFPTIQDGKSLNFDANGLGHPCIHSDVRVCNDYQNLGRGNIHLLTGSNMSGKSTFLRTVGLNWVLALAGAPCCAKTLRCSLTRILTSMRIQDSLAQGTSYFYAEVKRLKTIVDDLSDEVTSFVLLDEILKGTNSRERFIATAGLTRFLVQQGASGIISTHDLELLKLAGKMDEHIENFHFSEIISDEKMGFDFKLKPGQLTSVNALRIMELAGFPFPLKDIEEP